MATLAQLGPPLHAPSMTTPTEGIPEMTPTEAIAALGLTVEAQFVPFSQSRNKDENHRSLNWSVTVKRNGRDVLTTDYSAGIAHCPSYNAKVPSAWNRPDRMWQSAVCEFETDTGFKARGFTSWGGFSPDRKAPILPKSEDVLYSLTTDAGVLDCATYEDFAAEFGYEPDSRKGEAIYRACLEIALKMRAALGEDGLAQLREAFQDY
jgi:hypothetical protein